MNLLFILLVEYVSILKLDFSINIFVIIVACFMYKINDKYLENKEKNLKKILTEDIILVCSNLEIRNKR